MDIFVCVARTENPTLFFLRSKMSIKTFKSLYFMETSMGYTDKNILYLCGFHDGLLMTI